MDYSESEFQKALSEILSDINKNRELTSQTEPVGIVLGGQPGSGKSGMSSMINKRSDNDVLFISGDEYRKYHPRFNEYQEKYGTEAALHTVQFSGKIVESLIEWALDRRFNLVVEGTFRDAETPLRTLRKFKEQSPESAGFTPKESRDIAAERPAENAGTVFDSKLADMSHVYERKENKMECIYSNRDGMSFDERMIDRVLCSGNRGKNIRKETDGYGR